MLCIITQEMDVQCSKSPRLCHSSSDETSRRKEHSLSTSIQSFFFPRVPHYTYLSHAELHLANYEFTTFSLFSSFLSWYYFPVQQNVRWIQMSASRVTGEIQ